VGKTTLLRRLFFPTETIPDGTESTKGIDIHHHQYAIKDGHTMTLNVWDFGGQDIYHATHQFFLTKRSLYILVDDTRSDDTKAEDLKFKYWLEMIELLGGESPVLIFQNEKSGRSKDLDKAGIRKQFPNAYQEFYAGDLIHSHAANALKIAIEKIAQALPHVGDKWPVKWWEIRQHLERASKNIPHVSRQAYQGIYNKYLPFSERDSKLLSGYLHDLGVLLHFQDDEVLNEIIILQNEWGTGAVFRILDDEQIKKAYGHFTKADCERIWNDENYKGMHRELRQLMMKFELCYELRDCTPATWLATQLLPQAPTLHDFGEIASDLVLRYEYDVLPKGMVPRLMVRMNRYVRHPELAWRQGIIFEHRETKVLVNIPYGKREIHLRARGENPHILLMLISEDLEALNGTFEGLKDKIRKMVPCICRTCQITTVPFLHNFDKLMERKHLGKKTIECGNAPFEEIKVIELLEGIGYQGKNASEIIHDFGIVSDKNMIRHIRIFLASSQELEYDRKEFEIFINRENKYFVEGHGVFLKLELWEDFIDAMSQRRLQDEYNKIVRGCDLFVSLFWTKVGPYTREEFEAAFGAFQETGTPHIYTYFNETPVEPAKMLSGAKSLNEFQDTLNKLGHFHTHYKNIDDLKHLFSKQLRTWIPKLLQKETPQY
jgi:internalin A